MSIRNRPLQPPAHSLSIDFLIIMIILDDSDHHTRLPGRARERERGGGGEGREREKERER